MTDGAHAPSLFVHMAGATTRQARAHGRNERLPAAPANARTVELPPRQRCSGHAPNTIRTLGGHRERQRGGDDEQPRRQDRAHRLFCPGARLAALRMGVQTGGHGARHPFRSGTPFPVRGRTGWLYAVQYRYATPSPLRAGHTVGERFVEEKFGVVAIGRSHRGWGPPAAAPIRWIKAGSLRSGAAIVRTRGWGGRAAIRAIRGRSTAGPRRPRRRRP